MNGYPHIFDDARRRYSTVDMARRRPTSGTKMAAIQTGSGNNRCWPTLGHVVSGISESGMVENVGVAAEIASLSLSVQKIFILPVCFVAILRFTCRPTLGHVVSCISESSMVENVEVAAEIVSPPLSIQKLFLLPVSSLPF